MNDHSIGDRVKIIDHRKGYFGKEGKIIKISDVKGISIKLYTVEFDDGTEEKELMAGDFKKI